MANLVDIIAGMIWERHFVPEGFPTWLEATKPNPWQFDVSTEDGFNIKTPPYIKGRVLYCQQTARDIVAAITIAGETS